jgi:hypothetical protein
MTKKVNSKSDVIIAAPNIQTADIKIVGNAPYVQHKFSAKARKQMLDAQIAGPRGKARTKKEPRDIEADYKGAMHLTSDGKHGIPAPAFRSAMISACRVAGYQMTRAKLAVFVEADDFDQDDGTPLVYLKGKPELHQGSVRLAKGVASIAIRPMWRKWSATVRVKFDGDMFSLTDIINLLSRAGMQVGIGEGRPDSKASHGMGWGTFDVLETT